MGFDRFARTCSWSFSREPVVGLSHGFRIVAHEQLVLITKINNLPC